ncbi:MAG: efflux RND transporter periplasmic adaptor subunit [Kiritimatiellae bacterium]|nr:efflux RND transporter periplasmic adaptor subunit [Kiritimatiellia bacterium]
MTQSNMQSEEDVGKTLGLSNSGPRHPRLKYGAMAGLAAAVAIAGALWFTGRKTDAPRYITQPVRRGNLVVTVSATGTLAPIKEVDVGIEVSGTIKTVEADYNDEVKVGQVLARLDSSRLEAQALQSESALASARAKVLQTQATVQEAETKWKQLNRVHELSGGKMPAQSDLDAAKATLARAQADEVSAKALVAQAQATLNVNQTDVSKSVIHSPINGVVLTRAVEPGQTVAASLASPVLFTLAEDLKQMELLVDIDEADVGQVQKGQEATFTVDAYPDREFPARITLVRFGSKTVEGVVTYKAELRVDNSSLALRPGMTATAVITVNKIENALLIPNAALRFVPPQTTQTSTSGGGSLVSALMPHPPSSEPKSRDDANGKSKEQRVWILHSGQLAAITISKGASDGLLTEVTGGKLDPGMEVVTDTETVKQ